LNKIIFSIIILTRQFNNLSIKQYPERGDETEWIFGLLAGTGSKRDAGLRIFFMG